MMRRVLVDRARARKMSKHTQDIGPGASSFVAKRLDFADCRTLASPCRTFVKGFAFRTSPKRRRQLKNRKKGSTKMRVAALSSLFATCAAGALLAACGGGDSSSSSVADSTSLPAPVAAKCDDSDQGGSSRGGRCRVALRCDNSMITAFKPDANTTVTLVKAFKKGDSLALSATPASPPPPIAANDMCLVKLTIGPGNPGAASA